MKEQHGQTHRCLDSALRLSSMRRLLRLFWLMSPSDWRGRKGRYTLEDLTSLGFDHTYLLIVSLQQAQEHHNRHQDR